MPSCFPPRSSRHRPTSYATAARDSVSNALLSVSAWRRARRVDAEWVGARDQIGGRIWVYTAVG
jgi:hypothetical protein